jgi:uncharacterized protein YcaQ
MMNPQLSIQSARKLAVHKQLLSGERPPATTSGVMDVFRALGCVQLDPIRAVERTQYLVLWSRIGNYDRQLLHKAQFEERQLFEYWAHAASIVLTEHFPLHRNRMNRAMSKAGGKWQQQARAWMEANDTFRQFVREEIRRKQPVLSNEIEDRAVIPWVSGGWTDTQGKRSVTQMIDLMWTMGEVTVAERNGLRRSWMLLDDFLPEQVAREPLSDEQETHQSIQIALSALGVATMQQIKKHFTRSGYPNFARVFKKMEKAGTILPVTIAEMGDEWFMLAEDLPVLDAIQSGEFVGRTNLLSPFDNLICDRDRTEALWDFFFRIEIYVPEAKRQYGYYVLPILQGERLIGRIAPRLNRKTHILTVNGLYAEPDAPRDVKTATAIYAQLDQLANWIGAKEIQFNPEKPRDW